MTLVFATQFADEISAVMHGEDDAILQERLSALGLDERARLRKALGELELV